MSSYWGIFYFIMMPKNYITYKGKERTKLFRENFPFYPIPKQSDTCVCIHCMEFYEYKEIQVNESIKGDIWLMCRDYPECNGSIIDAMKTTKEELEQWKISAPNLFGL
jgi:hypothetical protein